MNERKSLRAREVYEACLRRVEKLTVGTRARWGSMNAAQMLGHCAEVQEVSNGDRELRNTPFFARLFKGMIRRMVLSDKPFPRNSRTHPQYKQDSEQDFALEKQRLLAALETFVDMDRTKLEAVNHPLFGKLTAEEKGWSMYKHLDHHLSQFGV